MTDAERRYNGRRRRGVLLALLPAQPDNSPSQKEKMPEMTSMEIRNPFACVWLRKLADSIAAPLPVITPRRTYGTLPGKAMAVIGMRRVGKTTLVSSGKSGRSAASAGNACRISTSRTSSSSASARSTCT